MSRKKTKKNTRPPGEEAETESPAGATPCPEPSPEEQPLDAAPGDPVAEPLPEAQPEEPPLTELDDTPPNPPLEEMAEAPPDPAMAVPTEETPAGTSADSQEAAQEPTAPADETVAAASPEADGETEADGEMEADGETEAEADTQASQDQPAGDEPTEAATDEISTDRVVEAVLFAADTPLPPQKIVAILGTGTVREVRKIVDGLNKTYARGGHAFRIEEIAGGYQILTLPQYNTWLRRLRQSKQESKLSPAAMETLAVVAYKQPVVRAQIEAIRGVSVGEVLNRLRELGLVKIVGRDEDVGRPLLYGTTRRFLETFGLSSLEDLPAVEELQMPK